MHTTKIPWFVLTAVLLFGGGLVFAAVATSHRLDSWDGVITTDPYSFHQALNGLDALADEVLLFGFTTTAVLLALAFPFLALRRYWATVVTRILAVPSVLMAVLLGLLQRGSDNGGRPYPDAGWAGFCSSTATSLIVIGAIGAVVTLSLDLRRAQRGQPSA